MLLWLDNEDDNKFSEVLQALITDTHLELLESGKLSQVLRPPAECVAKYTLNCDQTTSMNSCEIVEVNSQWMVQKRQCKKQNKQALLVM